MTHADPYRQRGVAAIEFAFAFPVMFLMLYGLLTFGDVFYTQITVSRAISDGARAVPLVPLPTDGSGRDYELVKTEIIESLANTRVVPSSSNGSLTARRTWLESKVRSGITVVENACTGSTGGTCVVISLSFPYSDADGTRLLPGINIPGIGGTEDFIPDNLQSTATVRL